MAEGKKSFVLYSDQRSIIDMLPNDKAGILLKHIFAYVNDENPINDDPLILLAFEPIKLQMKRDLIKWESTKEGRSAAGKASAEARRLAKEKQQTSTNPTNVDFVQQTSTNPTVNDNVTVTVNDTVINTTTTPKGGLNERENGFLNWFNGLIEKKTGKKGKFKTLSKTDKNNLKQLRESYSEELDWESAFNGMWNSKWCQETGNVTPTHLLRVDNFNKYLNGQAGGSTSAPRLTMITIADHD